MCISSEFKIKDMSDVFCVQYDFSDGYCIGTVKGYDGLHLICRETQTAKKLPDEYQETPIYISPDCGGYKNGLIMVSRMGKMRLAYHHNKYGCAGLWGWIDKDFNTVIEPQYIFAENFYNGKAIVSKGKWIQLAEHTDAPQGYIWATAKELQETYALPSAFAAFTKQILAKSSEMCYNIVRKEVRANGLIKKRF